MNIDKLLRKHKGIGNWNTAADIVRDIVRDLDDRRGFGWGDVAEETQQEIVDKWMAIVKSRLSDMPED